MPNFVSDTIQVHIAREADDGNYEFLILRRSAENPVYPSLWQVVTGRIEQGETAFQAAVREVNEETCLAPVKIWSVPYTAVYFVPLTDEIHASPVFGILVSRGAECTLSGEHQDYRWLSIKECIERLPLPSHKEGTSIFFDCILNNDDRSWFEIS